jgi:hypothetical protein
MDEERVTKPPLRTTRSNDSAPPTPRRLYNPAHYASAGKWTDAATGECGDLLDVIRESRGLLDFHAVAN